MIDFILKWLNVAVFKSYQTSKKQTPSGQVRKGQVSLDQTVKESCQNLSELREKNIFEPEIIQLIKTKIFKVLIESVRHRDSFEKSVLDRPWLW